MTTAWLLCLALGLLFSVEGSVLHKERQKRSEGELCSNNPNQDWRMHGNSCYLVRNRRKTYDEAMADCRDTFGGVVATIGDSDEFEFVKSIAEELFAVQNKSYWIGADDRTGEWDWVDNTELDFEAYAWGQPNSTHGHCLVVAASGLWRANECDKLRRYVCEKSLGARTGGGDVPDTPEPTSQAPVDDASPEPPSQSPDNSQGFFFTLPMPDPDPSVGGWNTALVLSLSNLRRELLELQEGLQQVASQIDDMEETATDNFWQTWQ